MLPPKRFSNNSHSSLCMHVNGVDNMKRIFLSMIFWLLTFHASGAFAAPEAVPVLDGLFYYQIGGGDPLTLPPAPILTTINLNFSISPTGLACGNFDPQVAIENFFDDLKNGADDMMIALQNAASAAIAALPGYLLQKANPTLYDIFQNGLLRAWSKFTLATKTCEQMMHEIGQGVDPYEKWITASAGDEWKISAGTGGLDIINVREDIEQNKGNSGKRWVGGVSCGGVGQTPCRPLRDTVQAGFNISLDRPVLANTPVPVTPASPELVEMFDSPADVRKWVLDVLGDDEIVTCKGCSPGSQPGRGLLPLIDDRKAIVELQLRQIVIGGASGGLDPTRSNLEVVSAPGVGVSAQVIQSIREIEDDATRGIVVARLSSEIASAQVLEEALVIRRLLLTGRREGNIKGIGPAQSTITEAIQELEAEIQAVRFEADVRKSMVTPTVARVLEQARAYRQSSVAITPKLDNRNREFNHGRVEP